MFSIRDFLYYDLLQHGDDFYIRTRKFVLAITFVVGCVFFLLSLREVWLLVYDMSPTNVVNALSELYMSVLTIGCWVFVKRTRTAPAAIMDLWMWSINLGSILFSFGTNQLPFTTYFYTLAIIALLFETDQRNYHIVTSAVGFLLVTYDHSMPGFGYPSLILPGSHIPVFYIRQTPPRIKNFLK